MLAMSAMTLGAFAQKNSILVSGNFGFNSATNAADVSTTTINFAPRLGYEFKENMTIGLNFGYASSKTGDAAATSAINFGPFFRYNMPLGDIFSIYTDVYANYSSLSNDRGTGFNFGVTPGVMAKLGKGWATTFNFANLGYMSSGPTGAKTSSFGLNVLGLGYTDPSSVMVNSYLGGLTFGIQKNFGLK
jgi:hypothetical protein